MAAGYNPMALESAAERNFNPVGEHNGKLVRSALYASDAITQQFWKEFMSAARVLRGGGKEMKEAA